MNALVSAAGRFLRLAAVAFAGTTPGRVKLELLLPGAAAVGQSVCFQPWPGINSRLPEWDLQPATANSIAASSIKVQIFFMVEG